MKKLQNNYTTPEQSKRLLELDVPKDSADCYITWKLDHTPKVNVLDNETYSELLDHISQFTVPCWSVGRLIEIYEICSGKVWDNTVIEGYSKIDMLLEDFDNYEYRLNFSNLEE